MRSFKKYNGIAYILFLTLAIQAFALSTETARGEEQFYSPDLSLQGRSAFYSGIDVAGSSFYAYGGFIASPWSYFNDNGVRIKVEGGSGQYKYDSSQVSGAMSGAEFSGQLSSLDVLFGYHYREGHFSSTLWLGGKYDNHDVFPLDTANKVQGGKLGVKAEINVWKGLDDFGWVSMNGSYSTTFEDYWAEARAAARLSPQLSLGVEGALYGNKNYAANRVGGFVRVESSYADITLSGGYGGNHDEEMTPYVSLNIYRKF